MKIEQLSARHFAQGFFETLASLGEVSSLPYDQVTRYFRDMMRSPFQSTYVMINDVGDVVGTATLLMERKFLHDGGLVAHIEDVAVRKGFRVQGIGRALIQHVIAEARTAGCYKAILNCSSAVAPFYERSGFYENSEICMRINLK